VAIPMQVILLGTGAALPTPERRTSGTAVLYEGETLLFDCGEGIQLQLRKAGLRHGRLSRIFITHMHGDHMGGVAGAVRDTGATPYGSAETQAALVSADEEASAVALARSAGIYPPDFALTATEQARTLSDGQALLIGDVELTAVATPGHCAGHVSYVLNDDTRHDLFAGDAVFWRGRVLAQAVPDCDPWALAESLARLAGLEDIAGLFPGHGAFTVQDAGRHLAAAADHVRALRMPPGL
jgi:glyoxylase-like metal-dependent hydrolase (beta-lactamase superfamily II)